MCNSMRMGKGGAAALPLLVATVVLVCSGAVTPGYAAEGKYTADFDRFWSQIASDYPYFATKATDWACVKAVYRPRAAATDNAREFIRILERSLDELYDPHASLNVNLPSSTRLIPTGLDLWAEWRDGRAIVTQVRPGSAALHVGVRAGMEVLSMNGVAIDSAVQARLGQCQSRPDPAARDWALLAVLAGKHDTPRVIEIRSASGATAMRPDDAPIDIPRPPGVTSQRLEGNLGYIAIHDLGAGETVGLFDSALADLRHSAGLVLDLRDTAAGGSTNVAEPIMGRLISSEQAYQRVQPRHRKAWVAKARPRGTWTYRAPVVVLVSRWTGSMGEGMAIGLDGMHRARIVGTAMAGLNGGVFTHHLPAIDVDYTVPGEALAHLDGTARERFRPGILVDLADPAIADDSDPILSAGIRVLQRQLSR